MSCGGKDLTERTGELRRLEGRKEGLFEEKKKKKKKKENKITDSSFFLSFSVLSLSVLLLYDQVKVFRNKMIVI